MILSIHAREHTVTYLFWEESMQRKLMIIQNLHMCERCEGVEMIVIKAISNRRHTGCQNHLERGALRALGMKALSRHNGPHYPVKAGSTVRNLSRTEKGRCQVWCQGQRRSWCISAALLCALHGASEERIQSRNHTPHDTRVRPISPLKK